MLLELLKHDTSLNRYFCDFCAERGISVKIDSDIKEDDILIIRVDGYYNHLVKNPDCSPDCLIIQRCDKNIYNLYIIDLRNINSPDGFKIKEIKEKFITCLDDFMSNRFASLFHNLSFFYKNIFLLFITDPYDFKNYPSESSCSAAMMWHKEDVCLVLNIKDNKPSVVAILDYSQIIYFRLSLLLIFQTVIP